MDKDNSNVIDDKEKIKELEKKNAILETELQRIKEHIKKETSQVYDKEDNTTIFEQIIIFGLETFFTIFSFIIKP